MTIAVRWLIRFKVIMKRSSTLFFGNCSSSSVVANYEKLNEVLPKKRRKAKSQSADYSISASDVRNSQHWMTQAEIAYVARILYGFHSDNYDGEEYNGKHEQGANIVAFFEIVGSTCQFSKALQKNIPGLESGRFSTLTFIVNLNENHWVSVIVARQGITNRRLVAYYANSLGQLDVYSLLKVASSPIKAVDNNYQSIKAVLENAVTGFSPGSGLYANAMLNIRYTCVFELLPLRECTIGKENKRGIDFMDVSCNVQHDGSNCGVYALESAKILNTLVSDPNVSHQDMKERLRETLEKEVDTTALRNCYAHIIEAEEAPNF